MTRDEDTDETVVCTICGGTDRSDDDGLPQILKPAFWECGHLVAQLDKTFGRCTGGALLEKFDELKSIIEDALMPHLLNGTKPKVKGYMFKDLWTTATKNFYPEDRYLDINWFLFSYFLEELLMDAGADLADNFVSEEHWGAASSVSFFFAKKPSEVIDRAKELLSINLGMSVDN